MRKSEDRRLTRLSKICSKLPGTTRLCRGDHASFLVMKKTFAYFLNNHHGDGKVALACKVLVGDNNALAKAQPDRFFLPAYIASKGWVGLRLDVGEADWDEVSELIRGSYLLVAPKRLASAIRDGD
jgi:hypothetical protein